MRSGGKRGGAARGPALWPVIVRLLPELGPLLIFFAAYKAVDFMAATAAFVAAVIASAAISWSVQRRLPLLPAFSTVLALVAGGLTLGLAEEYYLKMRPTLLNGIYGVALLGSLLLERSLLQMALDGPLKLTERGWRGLTWRLGAFLIALSVVNEIVWRTQSTAFWVNFKVFGILPLDIAFLLSQWPFVIQHWCASARRD